MLTEEDKQALRDILGEALRDSQDMTVADWIEERYHNAVRIAADAKRMHASQVEEGWLEDARYLREAAESLRLLEWRPISTAPKDGTLILGFAVVDSQTGNWKMRIMSHDSYAEVGMRNNWSGWGDSWVGPTHWMPLPKPPKPQGPTP